MVRPVETARVNALARDARDELAAASRHLLALLRHPAVPSDVASCEDAARLKDAVCRARDACGRIDYMTRYPEEREFDPDSARDDFEAMKGWD